MPVTAFILTALLSVPSLSPPNLERLINDFLSPYSVTVTLTFGSAADSKGEAALARAGLAGVTAKSRICGIDYYTYRASPAFVDFARQRHWKISEKTALGVSSITIPVGKYTYIPKSASIFDASSQKWLDFNY